MSSPPAARSRRSILTLRTARAVPILAVLTLLGAVTPAMPAAWVSVTHYHAISTDGAYSVGTLTITSCAREVVPHAWTCRGDYQVTDPIADSGHDQSDIVLVNDYHRYSPGDEIGVSTQLHEDAAYLPGTYRLFQVLMFWLGILAAVAAIGLVFLRQRRYQLVGVGAAIASALF